ncbi:MAG: diguanylate cyclase [Oscillospiraceae bacterium]|nr:diguanylate cyclase [Oscillospiraceae bacterium]
MKKNLLVIGDGKNFYYIIEALFRGRYAVLFAETEEQAIAALEKTPVNLIILLPNMKVQKQGKPRDSFRFFEKLRNSEVRRADTPAVFTGPTINAEVIAKAKKCNISDVIRLPVDPLFLESKVDELILKYALPHEKPDPVTGLPKRRLGEERIADLLAKGKKGALILIDLDHYSFLSTSISDKTMVSCRNIIQEEADDKTVLSVTKGGGFLIFVMDLRDKEKIEKYGEALIQKILAKIKDEAVFVSVGLAVSDRHGKNYEDLYFACDRGIGEARRLGKNVAKFYSW